MIGQILRLIITVLIIIPAHTIQVLPIGHTIQVHQIDRTIQGDPIAVEEAEAAVELPEVEVRTVEAAVVEDNLSLSQTEYLIIIIARL